MKKTPQNVYVLLLTGQYGSARSVKYNPFFSLHLSPYVAQCAIFTEMQVYLNPFSLEKGS